MKIVVFLAVVVLTNGAKLPSQFKKCNRNKSDFNDCLSKAVEDAIKQLNKPIKEVNLPSIEPLEVSSLTIGVEGGGAVGLQQIFRDVKIYGYSKPVALRFNMDFAKKTAQLDVSYSEIKMETQYEIKGKILLIPVSGKGPGSVIMQNVNATHVFNLEETEKGGKKHLKVIGCKISLTPGLVQFKFENLLDGDKIFSDSINNVLNENWREVFVEVRSSYQEAFEQILSNIFNRFLDKVPEDEIFE